MTDALIRYKKEVMRNLRCCADTKPRLMERFDRTLSPFLKDCADPDKESLYAAFGPPESMAGLLMSEIRREEVVRYRRQTRLKHIAAGVLATAFMVFTFYVFFVKQSPLEVRDEIIIEAYWQDPDETPPLTLPRFSPQERPPE